MNALEDDEMMASGQFPRMGRGLALLLALCLLPAAMAEDPSVNESDFDDSVPPADDSYLDEDPEGANADSSDGSTADPTVTEDDFDTSMPSYDDSWLDDESDYAWMTEDEPDLNEGDLDTSLPGSDGEYLDEDVSPKDSGTTNPQGESKTPGSGATLVVASLAALALARRK